MKDSIDVLIIEDDFRVAEINRKYVEKEDGYQVLEVAKTGEEALNFLEKGDSRPHLILLDIYIPDVEGMELFWKIRENYHDIDLIAVTAANEAGTIKEALRGGIFDYIIKPVDSDRISQALKDYKEYCRFFAGRETIPQHEIDLLKGIRRPAFNDNNSADLPKGIDPITLHDIKEILEGYTKKGITAVELSKQIGTSRSTARRYLEYLVSTKEVYTALKYGSVGRPEREYFLREAYEQNE